MVSKQQKHSAPIKGVGQLVKILAMDRDALYAVVNAPQDHYAPYDIYKKTDERKGLVHWRHIDNPQGPLKHVQELLTEKVLPSVVSELPDCLVGGLPGRSLKDNATPHVGRNVVVEMDLERCFESITKEMVYRSLITAGYGRAVAAIITKACTFQNRLPQGSPASTILCNLALRSMAEEIDTVARKNNCNFTMYIDDITISGSKTDVYSLIPAVYSIATRHHMKINDDKTEIFFHNRQQEVTGILTNLKLAIAKRKIELIRRRIIRMSKEPILNKRDLMSVYGQIFWVQFIDADKGKILHDLAVNGFADKLTYDGKKERKKTKMCKGYATNHILPVKV